MTWKKCRKSLPCFQEENGNTLWLGDVTNLWHSKSVLFSEKENSVDCRGLGLIEFQQRKSTFEPVSRIKVSFPLISGEIFSSRTVFLLRKLFLVTNNTLTCLSLSSKSRLVFLLCGKHFTSGTYQKSLEDSYRWHCVCVHMHAHVYTQRF